MNKVEIAGGLTREPELRFLESGAAVLNLTVAVNGTRYDSQARQQVVTTSYISVEAWGSLAEEFTELDVSKGSEVHVIGELTQRTVGEGDKKESKTRVRAMVLNVVRRKGGARPPAAAAPAAPGYDGPPPAYNDDEEPFRVDAGEWWPDIHGCSPTRILP